MLPSIFISHGSPALLLSDNTTTDFLKELSSKFERPKYILVVSAHWVSDGLKILYEDKPNTIHDFYNFPQELYNMTYKASSSKEKSDEIVKLLEKNNIRIEKDDFRGGYDHGVWSPLKLIYPKADIPVIQISLPINYTSKELFDLGEILSSLKNDTLIIGSGSLTHNLMDLDWNENNPEPKDYVKTFRNWIVERIENKEIDELINYRQKAPFLSKNHPTLEHFLPLFVTLGSAKNRSGKSLNNIYTHGNLSMDTIIFDQ